MSRQKKALPEGGEPLHRRAMMWVVGGDCGVSSRRIWAEMQGIPADPKNHWGSYPHDPDDFGRCYRLLKYIPEWRPRIGEMSEVSPQWSRLAAAWDELESLYEAEVDMSGPHHRGMARKLYARMQEIIDGRPTEKAIPSSVVPSVVGDAE